MCYRSKWDCKWYLFSPIYTIVCYEERGTYFDLLYV